MTKELKSGILSADKSADCRPTVGGVNVIAVIQRKRIFSLESPYTQFYEYYSPESILIDTTGYIRTCYMIKHVANLCMYLCERKCTQAIPFVITVNIIYLKSSIIRATMFERPLQDQLMCLILTDSRGTKVGDRRILAPERYTHGWILYGYKGNSMVYLKSLYSRLDRIAIRHGRRFSMEARSVHVKLLCRKTSNKCVSKYRK